MKSILFLLLFVPLFSPCQTIHRKGDKIIYKGNEALPGRTAAELLSQLQATVGALVQNEKNTAAVQLTENSLTTIGNMRLKGSNAMARTAYFTLQVTAKDGGYSYNIDSVYVTEKKGNGSTQKRSDKELLKNMETTGPVADAAEKLLNEIDMNFQKMLAVLRNKMKAGNNAAQ
jgi:hypothetical protein